MTGIEPNLEFFGNLVEASTRVDDLKAYLSSVDDFLRESSERRSGKRNALGIDESFLYDEPLPSILYSTVITAVVGLLEQDLRGFAQSLREAEDLSLSLRELSGSWLDRFLTYAEKLAHIDLGLSPQLIEDVRGAVEVRNCLVHSGGQLRDCQGRKAVEAFVRRKGLHSVTADVLSADASFAQAAIDVVSTFVETCYGAALRRYPGARP